MSEEQNLEEATAGEHRDGTNSVSENIQRGPNSSAEIQEIRSIRKLQKSNFNIAKGQPCVKKIFNTHGSYRNWVFLVWCVTVIFVDTWFLYIPMINGDKKCIEFDKDLWTAASAGRSVFDLFYVIDNIFRLDTGICKSSRKRSWILSLFDVLIILPIPQFFWSRTPNEYQSMGEYLLNLHYACGVWLLVILVGKIQTYTKSGSISEGMRQKEKELEQWLPFRKLSQNLQQQIKYHLHSWDETMNFDIENLVYNLPEDLGREIKSELCLELLKKVEEFGKWRKALSEDLCEFVKPVVYTESSLIVHEGGSIDKLVFVVQGNLRTYNSGGITAAPPNTDNYDCDICGEELVAWAQDACARTDSTSSALPNSAITIQALTKVEAFVLMADDLKKVLQIKHNRAAPFIQADRFFTIFMDATKGTFMPSTSSAETSTQQQVPPTIRSKQLVETQIIAKEK